MLKSTSSTSTKEWCRTGGLNLLYVFKMVASNGLIEVRIFIFELHELSYLISDFDRICGRLHGLISA